MTPQRPFSLTSKRLLVVLAVVALSVFGVWFWNHSRKESASVAAQLKSLDPDKFQMGLAKITTNEIPMLLEMLQTTDGPMKKKLVRWVRETDWLKFRIKDEVAFRLAAASGFEALGSNAVSAIPQLSLLLESGNPDAAFCLAGIGAQTLPVLVSALTNNDWRVRHSAASSLGIFETNGVAAIPNLLHALKDQHELVRSSSADSLGQIKMKPEIVVPALINALDNTDFLTQWRAALALGEFGPLAKDAVPKLIKLIETNSKFVSEEALEALQKIDPEAAARFAPK